MSVAISRRIACVPLSLNGANRNNGWSISVGPVPSHPLYSVPKEKSKLLKSFRTFIATEFTRGSESNPL